MVVINDEQHTEQLINNILDRLDAIEEVVIHIGDQIKHLDHYILNYQVDVLRRREG